MQSMQKKKKKGLEILPTHFFFLLPSEKEVKDMDKDQEFISILSSCGLSAVTQVPFQPFPRFDVTSYIHLLVLALL